MSSRRRNRLWEKDWWDSRETAGVSAAEPADASATGSESGVDLYGTVRLIDASLNALHSSGKQSANYNLEGAVDRAWADTALPYMQVAKQVVLPNGLIAQVEGPAHRMLSPAELSHNAYGSDRARYNNEALQAATDTGAGKRSGIFGRVADYFAGVGGALPRPVKLALGGVAAAVILAACGPVATSAPPTNTPTPGNTPTATAEPTATPESTPTPVPTATPTPLWTPTPTPLWTPTPTPTQLWTPTPVPTATPTPVPTLTPTPIIIATPTPTATLWVPTPTPTQLWTPTPTPTPPTPTPKPTPTATATPVPNPAVVYATSPGVGISVAVVDAGLYRLGLDGFLADNERAFIDVVAANPSLDVQFAMAASPYVFNRLDKGGLEAAVKAADVLRKYDAKLRAAVWSMPDKSIVLPSGGSVNPSSMLELILKNDVTAVKVLDYVQFRVFDNSTFWDVFNAKGDVVDWGEVVDGGKRVDVRYPSGYLVRSTLVPFDAKKWPVNRWQGLVALTYMQANDFAKKDRDAVLNELGVYPGMCVYCIDPSTGEGKVWDMSTESFFKPNGSRAYDNLVGSEGNIMREWLDSVAHLAWRDGEGQLVRPFRSNTPEEMWLLFSRNPNFPSGIGTAAYGNQNVSFTEEIELPDGSRWDSYRTSLAMSKGTTEAQVVFNVLDWYLQNITHFTGSAAAAMIDIYGKIFEQNPSNPPAPALYLKWKLTGTSNISGSGLNVTSIASLLRSRGVPAEAIIPGNSRLMQVTLNGMNWYLDGNMLFSKDGSTSACSLLGTYEQVNSTRRGDGSACLLR